MTNNALVSVIIPVWNTQNYLPKCLEHIVHQSYANLEIIIVDDGSVDGSAEVYNSYAKRDKRIKLVKQENKGASAARNAGLALATGDFVHFMDSDDYVDLDFYETMAKAAAGTSADAACCCVRERGYFFPIFKSVEILLSLDDKILKTCSNRFNTVWRFLYKTEFLRKNRLAFKEDVATGEDLIFSSTAIILARSVCTVPNAFYNVVDNPNSLGKQPAKPSPTAHQSWQGWRDFLKEHKAEPFDFGNWKNKDYILLSEYKIGRRITVFSKRMYARKIQYYFFGIPLLRKV